MFELCKCILFFFDAKIIIWNYIVYIYMIIMYVMPSLVLMRHDMNEALQHIISTCSICASIHMDQTVHNI